MTKIYNRLSSINQSFNETIKIIENSGLINRNNQPSSKIEIREAESLLSKCSTVVAESTRKPKIRIISHPACSGGSLLSKCIAALPNVFVLSEVHPTTRLNMYDGKSTYNPTDLVMLGRYANVPKIDSLSESLFVQNIKLIHDHIEKRGGILVLREHSHADYFVGKNPEKKSKVISLLEKDFDILSLVTIRHPVDCYLSLLNNGWIHYQPTGFGEYCRRFLSFIESIEHEEIIKYEDFVSKPKKIMKFICNILELEYDQNFTDLFWSVNMTGDSGRSSSAIEKRKRREVQPEFRRNALKSKRYRKLVKSLNYNKEV